ncbi:MAG: hypothetical protein ACRDR6_01000 [Pseudonocardiaceae bacterium]
MAGQLSGRVGIRPIRLGMAFEATKDYLQAAVEHATSVWGGLHDPFLCGDTELARQRADSLAVDVVWALDNAPASTQLAELLGYRWRGRGEWGPLAPTKEYFNTRLISPVFLFPEADHSAWALPVWDSSDPLCRLFTVWFGVYGDSGDEQLRNQFVNIATQLRICLDQEVPDIENLITPIKVTTLGIDYAGRDDGWGFAVIDSQDPSELVAFWNLRASGLNVFPWPLGHSNRIAEAARCWLQTAKNRGVLERWRTGDGRPVGPQVSIWRSPATTDIPQDLTTLLNDMGVKSIYRHNCELISGWTGTHPCSTGYTDWFKVPTEQDGRSAEIPLPHILVERRRSEQGAGTVAVDLEIAGVSTIEPGWTFATPNRRDLALLLPQFHTFFDACFHRPTHDGRALGVSAKTETIKIHAIPSMMIIEKLAQADGWSCQQNDNGIFACQLVERLGGPGYSIANQPGIRAALEDAALSANGCTSGQLVQKIQRFQGDWPDPLSHKSLEEDYPGNVLRHLLNIKILQPVLPIICPHCRTKTPRTPENLASEMTCQMCLRQFPLGLSLALSVNGRNDWLYQLASHVSIHKLREVLSVMATLQILTTLHPSESPSMVPHVLGVEFKTPGKDCEIDIISIHGDQGIPTVVVGEVKSWQGNDEQENLQNLRKSLQKLEIIQRHLRAKGIECVVLVAAMRALGNSEVNMLRTFAERPLINLPTQPQILPVLPIIFTANDLSVPYLHDDHPTKNMAGYQGILALAEQSCRRNLGLTALEHAHDDDGLYFQPQWAEPENDQAVSGPSDPKLDP